jgi:hypothetical protein
MGGLVGTRMNDEISNEERTLKPENRMNATPVRHWVFGVPSSLRISSFVIESALWCRDWHRGCSIDFSSRPRGWDATGCPSRRPSPRGERTNRTAIAEVSGPAVPPRAARTDPSPLVGIPSTPHSPLPPGTPSPNPPAPPPGGLSFVARNVNVFSRGAATTMRAADRLVRIRPEPHTLARRSTTPASD